MPESTTRILQIKNNLSEVERANGVLRDLCASCALPADLELPVTLAVEEVLSNVIRHGCVAGQDYDIQVR